ncbi:MDR family MFS transporter [Amycolatopsis jejuensis]|uniref:MDR family MFS transporter n=1 Tax=Amycolatopsis jejuensis TaxID=330084 RepID=UPI0005273E08|nr:MDR family MFS transporter [Amycolatopsis jejuensis]
MSAVSGSASESASGSAGDAGAPEETGPGQPVPRNVRWVLFGVLLALLLALLDALIVGTAMPSVVRELGGLDSMSWVVTGYTLATACSTPLWGKLGDLFDRKRVFLLSIVLFLIASVACGMATSMGALIAFRVVQGLGAGGLGAGAFALIGVLVPPRERGRYQGMVAAVTAAGQLGGPLVGGLVTGHLGWRWAFYLNVPVGLVCIAWCAVLLKIPPVKRAGRASIDWTGIVLLTGAISAFVMAATWAGSTYAWGSWQIVGLGVLAVALLAGFIVVQRRAAEPLMPLRIYTGHRNFPLSAVLLVVAGVASFGATLYLPLYQQVVQGASAVNSGLLLLPMLVASLVTSNIAGKVMSATGRYKVFPVVGAACLAGGMLLLSTMDTTTSRPVTAIWMAVVGAGTGFCLQMANTIAQNAVQLRDIGAASAATNLFRNLGGSLGIAIFASLFTASVSGGEDVPSVAHATHLIFLTGGCLALAALLAAIFVEEVPLRGATPAETPVEK